MKIDLVGNHCTWTKELNTSYIIDDKMLFDVPLGSFKTLFNDYDIKKIEYVIISHFHSDHFGDLFLILDVFSRLNKQLTILAPKTCKQRIEMIMRAMDVTHLIPALDNFNFIDAENGKIVKLGNYKIKCFSVLHENLDAYGYTIDDGKTKVGFSGDSAMCNNIRKIAKASRAMFIDSANVFQNNKHLATFEVDNLVKEFPNTHFYPVHLSANSQRTLKDFNLDFKNQGEIIIIE